MLSWATIIENSIPPLLPPRSSFPSPAPPPLPTLLHLHYRRQLCFANTFRALVRRTTVVPWRSRDPLREACFTALSHTSTPPTTRPPHGSPSPSPRSQRKRNLLARPTQATARQGRAHFDRRSERGAAVRFSADGRAESTRTASLQSDAPRERE